MSTVSQYLESIDPKVTAELLVFSKEQQEALLEVVALAIYADGVAAVEELDAFAALAKELPGLSHRSESELDEMLANALERLRHINDPEAAKDALARIGRLLGSTQIREAAFGAATVIALADGVVVDTEKSILQALAAAFLLSPERLAAIVAQARAFVLDSQG